MIIKIQATAAILTVDEIKNAIPAETIAEIKKTDKNPLFQAYSLVQEGTSNPRSVGETDSQSIAWPRRAIESAKNVLKKGLQFFGGHNADNSTNGRKALAEFVGRLAKDVGGRLHEIVIGYFPDKENAKKYDVCSVEADIDTTEIPGSMTIAEKFERITGIALGNSAHDTPAFAGAKKLLSVQCFEGGKPSKKTIQGTENPSGGNPMTFEELRAQAKAMNVHPSQLYSLEEIKADRTFSAVFDERDLLKTENEGLKKTGETSTKKLADQEKQILRNDAKTRLDSFIPENATEGQKAFIAKKVKSKFDKLEDLTDDGLKGFVNENIEDYNEFGAKDEKSPKGDDDKNNENKDDDKNDEELSDVDAAVKDAIEN